MEKAEKNNVSRASSIFSTIKESFKELDKHDPLLLSSSVAFFTLFALPPMIIIIVNLFGRMYKKWFINEELYDKLAQVFGTSSSAQIESIALNFQKIESNTLITIAGGLFLVFVATTAFAIIQKALNQIWQVRRVPRNTVVNMFKMRGIYVVILILSGLLFLLSILSDAWVQELEENIQGVLRAKMIYLVVMGAHKVFSIAIITIWFAIIFKFLPDVRIEGKAIWVGALITGVLFTTGRFLLGILLLNSKMAKLYGAAGAVVLLLLFLFYSSLIFFYGAALTKVYAHRNNLKITSKNYATSYEINDVSD